MKNSAADLVEEIFIHAGIKRIYGVGDDSLNGISDSFRRYEVIKWIPLRLDEGAAFAVGAEAHLTGKLGRLAEIIDLADVNSRRKFLDFPTGVPRLGSLAGRPISICY